MGKLNINNGGVDTNKKMPDIDERFGPYTSIEAANADLGGQGRNTITAGLTVGILTANAGVKEWWYQPNKKTGQLELIPKGGNAADNPTEGNFASFDENGNVVDSGNKADDFAPMEQAVPMGDEDDEGKILEKQKNGFGWVDKPVDGKSALQIYNDLNPDAPLDEAGFIAKLQQKYPMKHAAYDATSAGKAINTPFTGSLYSDGPTPTVDTMGSLYIMPNSGTTPTGSIAFTTINTGEGTYAWVSLGAVDIPSNALTDDDVDNECTNGAVDTPASAKAVMDLKAKLEGVTASESKASTTTIVTGHFLNSNLGTWGSNASAKLVVCQIPQGTAKLRFLGATFNSGASSKASGFGFGTYNGTTWTPLKDSDDNPYAWPFDTNSVNSQGSKEYTKDIPVGATHISITLESTTISDYESSFYCYMYQGETVIDIISRVKEEVEGEIPQVVDGFDSDSQTDALSAKGGKLLNDSKMNRYKSVTYYEQLTGTKIDNSYINNTGVVTDSYRLFNVCEFQCEVGKKYRVSGGFGTGGGSSVLNSYLYCWLDSNKELLTNGLGLRITVDTMGKTVDNYITENAPEGAVYICVSAKKEQHNPPLCDEIVEELEDYAEIIDTLEEEVENKEDAHEYNILCLGNSFTADSMSYVPWLVREACPSLRLNIYFTFAGGATLEQYSDYLYARANSREFGLIYCRWSDDSWKTEGISGSSVSGEGVTADYVLGLKNWDLITIQQAGSYNYQNYESYFQPYINQIYAKLTEKCHDFAFGYIMSHSSYSDDGATLLNRYNNIVSNANKVLNQTPVTVLLPYATALQNARTTYLDKYGRRPNGHLQGQQTTPSSSDYHVTDGIGGLVCNYVNAMAIMDFCNKTGCVDGSQLYPDDVWLAAKSVFQHSVADGLSAYNCKVAQMCALMAWKNPLELSNMVQLGMVGQYAVELGGGNFSSSNLIESANSTWSTIITPDEGYEVVSVVVTVGGEEVSNVYDSETGEISISSINGNVQIQVTTQ